jgi:hopene-associated glycosyltransferase HpnB
MTVTFAIAAASLVAWLYLLAGRGGFWRAAERDDADVPEPPGDWPSVTAVIPARNEADVLSECLGSLLKMDYPGRFNIVLVDDQSEDGTGDVARWTAAAAGARDQVKVLQGGPLPSGWTGKLWAVKQGIAHASAAPEASRYLLLTDADIACSRNTLRKLVARAESKGLLLTSLMVKLRCESLAERWLVPAFVFFFQMLYPFSWVNRPGHPMAAAAGGCMLVRREALEAAGGIECIRGSLIDDCALGRAMKAAGPVWLGLTSSVYSLRPYDTFGDVRRMVARSAYDQLHYSPLLLAVTIAGMLVTFAVPPLFAIFATGEAQALGLLTWAVMALMFQPILRLYWLSPLYGAALPVIAALYMLFTLDSAYQHARGRGGMWKGRAQANRAGSQ